LDRIRGGAKDGANLLYCLDRRENVNRKRIAQEDQKAVPGGDVQHVLCRERHEFGVGSTATYQAITRRFAKREPELQTTNRSRQRLMQILDRFDEMALPKDKIEIVRVLNLPTG